MHFDATGLQRLAQRIQRDALKLRRLVEEEYAAVGADYRAGSGYTRAAPDERRD